jgi:predicted phosphodiesterase
VITDIEQWKVDAVLVAGDLIDGTHSPHVIERLQSMASLAIQGNREGYLLAYHAGTAPQTWQVSEQWAGLRRVHQQLAKTAIDYLASLPQERTFGRDGAPSIRMVHGTPGAASGLLVPEKDSATVNLFAQSGLFELSRTWVPLSQVLSRLQEEVLVCGHTHIPWVQRHGSKLALNPGSVGMPINGDARAQYALLTWRDGAWEARHRALAYDLEDVRRLYQESRQGGKGDAFTRASLLCTLTGRNVPGMLVLHVRRLATEAGHSDLDDAPDSIWDEAAATFNWELWEAME